TVRCSSGTYIRALARDLGAALNTGGHLTALRRTAVGPYTLAQSHPLKTLENQTQTASPERALVPSAPHEPPQSPPGTPSARDNDVVPVVIPLAEAAAAAFPRV